MTTRWTALMCPDCGGTVRQRNLRGKPFDFESYRNVILMHSVHCNQCERCKKILPTASGASVLREIITTTCAAQ